eukprot:21416-Heterococcus_DN1.PRE.4
MLLAVEAAAKLVLAFNEKPFCSSQCTISILPAPAALQSMSSGSGTRCLERSHFSFARSDSAAPDMTDAVQGICSLRAA